MFTKNKKCDRVNDIFNTLLLKFNKQALNIQEADIVKLYMRAIEISKTLESLEYMYKINGEIDKNLLTGEEYEEF